MLLGPLSVGTPLRDTLYHVARHVPKQTLQHEKRISRPLRAKHAAKQHVQKGWKAEYKQNKGCRNIVLLLRSILPVRALHDRLQQKSCPCFVIACYPFLRVARKQSCLPYLRFRKTWSKAPCSKAQNCYSAEMG